MNSCTHANSVPAVLNEHWLCYAGKPFGGYLTGAEDVAGSGSALRGPNMIRVASQHTARSKESEPMAHPLASPLLLRPSVSRRSSPVRTGDLRLQIARKIAAAPQGKSALKQNGSRLLRAHARNDRPSRYKRSAHSARTARTLGGKQRRAQFGSRTVVT